MPLLIVSISLLAPCSALLRPSRSARAMLVGGMPGTRVSLLVVCKDRSWSAKCRVRHRYIYQLPEEEMAALPPTLMDSRSEGVLLSHLRRPQTVEQQQGRLAAKWSWMQYWDDFLSYLIYRFLQRARPWVWGKRDPNRFYTQRFAKTQQLKNWRLVSQPRRRTSTWPRRPRAKNNKVLQDNYGPTGYLCFYH